MLGRTEQVKKDKKKRKSWKGSENGIQWERSNGNKMHIICIGRYRKGKKKENGLEQ